MKLLPLLTCLFLSSFPSLALALTPVGTPWRLEIRVDTGKSDRESTTNRVEINTVTLDFEVTLKNLDIKNKLSEATGTLVVFRKSASNNDEIECILNDTFPIEIEPGKVLKQKPTAIDPKKNPFTYSDSGPKKTGHKYHSYLFIVRNKKGEIIGMKGSSSAVEKFVDRIIPLTTKDTVHRDYRNYAGSKN